MEVSLESLCVSSNTDSKQSPELEIQPRISLDDLAPETLLTIMTELTDLDSLYTLIVASPKAWRLFTKYACLITESVLSSPDSLLAPGIQQFIRALILIRNSQEPFARPDDFVYFIHKHMAKNTDNGIKYDDLDTVTAKITASLATAITVNKPPTEILWSVVATARHVSVLTHGCLEFYLARIRSPSFTPKYLDHARNCIDPGDPTPPCMIDFEGTPLVTADIGQPSWVEETRVSRALWFVQLANEVTLSAPQRRDPKDGAEFRNPQDFIRENVNHSLINGPAEEVETVMSYLESLRTQPETKQKGPYYRLPRPPKGYSDAGWITPLPELRQQEWEDGQCYRLVYPNKVVEFDLPPDVKDMKDAPSRSTVARWDQTCVAIDGPSTNIEYWAGLSSDMLSSPIIGVTFNSYRRLGFALWDRKRMFFLGLIPGLYETFSFENIAQYNFAWESILPAEEARGLKEAQRAGTRFNECLWPNEIMW
ncbi:uncharacterized protein TrAtP1_013025 [Trichoderma atroviride]|uniref:F-box domain-containing protein n=1 Tax=Hypocrea atroviridis (strain ATCC 20476 / IMI 206040) TaxID=452589 RepID=G9NTA2_HYPAI|nr:uncharacterized protein TRIATDRAFT_41392 [Trichoderma atroviride IMI 206040]EHK45949.1 hypothetical protein TRIATDRAFT_41392 [Trichoderma atroviride IMI 206040]UKZ72087.1 hypothetical protein TrAtP1_013025 [Trichoderma atroviride]